MTWWFYILVVCICIGAMDFVIITCQSNLKEFLEEALNPIVIYKNNNVNLFGCVMLMLFGHCLLLFIAPVYWFYKLCTVGRR